MNLLLGRRWGDAERALSCSSNQSVSIPRASATERHAAAECRSPPVPQGSAGATQQCTQQCRASGTPTEQPGLASFGFRHCRGAHGAELLVGTRPHRQHVCPSTPGHPGCWWATHLQQGGMCMAHDCTAPAHIVKLSWQADQVSGQQGTHSSPTAAHAINDCSDCGQRLGIACSPVDHFRVKGWSWLSNAGTMQAACAARQATLQGLAAEELQQCQSPTADGL